MRGVRRTAARSKAGEVEEISGTKRDEGQVQQLTEQVNEKEEN